MVIAKLQGGLGNQMFQYAAARSLSLRTGFPLKLDTSWFKEQEVRTYKLDIFNIVEKFADTEDIDTVISSNKLSRFLIRLKETFLPWHQRRYLAQKEWKYESDICRVDHPVYMDGYWQSEKYFKDIESRLREEFTIQKEPDNVTQQYIDTIRSTENAVSLHIRRGDYVANPKILNLDLSYYQKAIEIISSNLNSFTLFVFSDDIDWVKQNLHTKFPVTFVESGESRADYEDLRLMSLCDHHIIANSSFSWWGAWLSKNHDKIVIAPKKWGYYKEQGVKPKEDMIPNTWLTI